MMRRFRLQWWMLLALPAVLGLLRLRFDVDVLNLLPPELPSVQGLKLYQRHFANSGELILTVESPEAALTESTAREMALALRHESNLVGRALWQPPMQEHPEQMTELLAAMWLNARPEQFARFAESLEPGKIEAKLEAMKESLATSLSPEDLARLGYDPLGFSQLAGLDMNAGPNGLDAFHSSDGRFRLVFVRPAKPLRSYPETAAWFESVKRLVAEARRVRNLPDQVALSFTGEPAFTTEVSTGMERDVRGSASGTFVVIAAMFWLAHRRWRPLAWLVAMLVVTIGGTLSLGGVLFGTLNIVSLGFAAILLGLGVDYGIVLYQESVDKPGQSIQAIRKEMAPGIWWSAITTSGAFALLMFAGLPGLAQLGALVGIGVMLAAVVMIYGFLPLVAGRGQGTGATARTTQDSAAPAGAAPSYAIRQKVALVVTALLVCVSLAVIWRKPPSLDHTDASLSPKHSPAYRAARRMQEMLARSGEPLWLVVSGGSEQEVAGRLTALEKRFKQADAARRFTNVLLPTALWPNPSFQKVNKLVSGTLVNRRGELHEAVRQAGFTEEAFGLADQVLGVWERAAAQQAVFWPTNEANQWLIEKFSARNGTGWLAAGMALPRDAGSGQGREAAALRADIAAESAWLTGWSLLGPELLAHAETRAALLLAVMVCLLLICLWLAFRSWTELLLSLAALGLGFLALFAVMSLAGWSWNLMNLIAAPLLLGAGVDYTIHVQLAMRRFQGDTTAMRRTTGRALILCAGTTIAGFGSLAWAGNEGLASLGKICGSGIAIVFLIAAGLLPAWWCLAKPEGAAQPAVDKPSSLYSAAVWRSAVKLACLLPRSAAEILAKALARVYWRLAGHRRGIVVDNLAPVLQGDREAAAAVSMRLICQFALKLVDLWRYEGGAAACPSKARWEGWPAFEAAKSKGKGVLIVTPHLGNWEFGASFFAEHGIPLLVLTQAEPQAELTSMRGAARAERGIGTIVVGENPFAFIEVIQQLQSGATVALLLDRPLKTSAVMVDLFNQPFAATIAAAELARASGCAIVPAYVVRGNEGYSAKILPEIAYERAGIGSRQERIALTGRIMKSFEPAIKEHLDQWFHFVPLWRSPADQSKETNT